MTRLGDFFAETVKKLKAKPPTAVDTAPVMARKESEFSTIVAGLTPQKMAAILKNAASGDDEAFLRLAEEMEELDPHYRSVLSTRKLALLGLEPEVEGEGEIADFVRSVVAAPAFTSLLTDMLDGLGKGYSAVQIIWDTEGGRWTPADYEWWPPQHFKWNRQARRLEMRLEDGKTIELPPFAYAVHVPKLKSGDPVRGALARIAAWSFLFKNYTLKDWVRFTEVYGMPIRVGKYGAGATEEDKRKLLRAVANIGSDAAAIIDSAMSIEFVAAAAGTASQGPVFGLFADYLDKQVSKAVLGQTLTTDGGASQAQATVHDDVRIDIKKADARGIEETVNRDVIVPLVILNFGPQKDYPRAKLPVAEPEDLKLFSESVMPFVDRGLHLSKRQIRDKFDLDIPVDEDDVLRALPPPASPPGVQEKGKGAPKAKKEAASVHKPGCRCGCKSETASAEEADEIDRLVEAAMAKAGSDMEAMIAPVLASLREAEDFDDLARRLDAAHGLLDAGAIVKALGTLTFAGRGLGDATDDPQG